MQMFSYSAKKADGSITKGEIAAKDYSDFLVKMREQNLFCLSYEITEEMAEGKSSFRLKGKDLVIFTRQLATMLSSGIPIVKAVDILYDKAEKKKLKQSLRTMYESLQQGKSLSQSMREQGEVYPKLLMRMIRSGEVSGTLDETLSKMAVHYEKENKLMNKVKGASIYPIILCILCVVIVIFLLTFIMPTFFELFEGQELPMTTQILVGISDFILEYWYIALFLVLVIFVVARIALKNHETRVKFDHFKLTMPIFGKLNKTILSARFARTFCTLYQSGVNVIEIMETISEILNNTYLEEKFTNVIAKISNGQLISTAVAEEDMFDPMLTSMIFIGEESGMLDKILEKTADFYDEEADAATQKMVSMMEPIMIIFLGVVVGFIVLSIIQPLYGSMNNVH